jgi:hypothetical protein
MPDETWPVIDRQAKAAYEAGMAGYARMTPLDPEMERLVNEPDWNALEERFKEHWREIVRAVMAA